MSKKKRETLRQSTQAEELGDRWVVLTIAGFPLGVAQEIAPGFYRNIVQAMEQDVVESNGPELRRVLNLMAAAPKMYAALTALCAGHDGDSRFENWDAAREAIAAAEGRSS